MKAFEAIKTGTKLLKEKNIPTYILDTELILSRSLNKSREEILINLEQNINKKSFSEFNKYLFRRSKKEPIAYLLGEKEFWSKKFFVNKDTLIPRPETELLVEKIVNIFKKKKNFYLRYWDWYGMYNYKLIKRVRKFFRHSSRYF